MCNLLAGSCLFKAICLYLNGARDERVVMFSWMLGGAGCRGVCVVVRVRV